MNKYIFKKYFLKFIEKYLLDRFHISEGFLFNKNTSILIENIYSILRGKEVRFAFDRKSKLFFAKEGVEKKYCANKFRCFLLYRQGIKKRGEFIFNSYRLNNLKFKRNDIVIDCGANNGDLFIELNKFIEPSNYFALEPNPSDFKSLKLNCSRSYLIQKGLGKENTKKIFYSSTTLADSSIIKPKDFEKKIKIKVIRFDDLIKKLKIKKVKLFKIEAEGYEPEILLGATEKISICEFIAIDGGYERGINEEQTFTKLTNYLIDKNFELYDIYFPWYRALFKNRNY